MKPSPENKIIHATFGNQSSNNRGIEDTVVSHAASVEQIQKGYTHGIYWGRDKNPESSARNFFDTFMENREVAFLYDTAQPPHIVRIRANNKGGYRYEISAEQFIYLTTLYPDTIEDTDEHIRQWFAQMKSKSPTTYKERIDITRLPLIESMIPHYHPEEEAALIEGTRDSYTCELYNHFGLIGYGLVENYQNATILDLMVAAFDKAELDNLPTEKSKMEIIFTEEGETTITEIGADIIEKVIYEALLRLDGNKYGKMNPSDARKYYFKHEVIPKII